MASQTPTDPLQVADLNEKQVDSPSATEDVSGNESNDNSDQTQDGKDEPRENWIGGWKLLTVLTGITLVSFLMLLDTSIISTAIPRITTDFHSLPDVGWYGSSYQLASASLQPLTGKFYSKYNTKWTYLSFFAIFEVGSVLCGAATSSNMLIVGRAVAGMGASGIQNGSFTIIAESVPMHKRPALIGMVMGVAQFGLIIGPLVGGALTEYSTWRWCFYINLPIGAVVAALLVFIHIPEQIKKPPPLETTRSLHRELDLIGFTLFAAAAIQLLLALQYGGNEFAWNSSTVIGLFCGAGATYIVFLPWEYRKGDSALIPFGIISKRIIWSSCLVFGFLMSLLYCVTYYLPIYFQAAKGVSPMMSGVYILPSILAQLCAAIISGVLVERVGYYLPFIVTGSVLNAIGDGLLSTFVPDTSTGKWIGYQILAGFGQGIGLQMPIIAVQNTLPQSLIPTAMALVMFSSTLGGSIFLGLSQTVLTNSLRSLIPKYAPEVDATAVIAAGATGAEDAVTASSLPGVLLAYSESTDRVFYLCVGAACACFVFSWGMGWRSILSKKPSSPA